MIDLSTALQLLALIPPLQFSTPAEPQPAPAGTGTLLVAGCRPGQAVSAGGRVGTADARGTARIRLPAQRPEDPPYLIASDGNEAPVHGALGPNELLSATCP